VNILNGFEERSIAIRDNASPGVRNIVSLISGSLIFGYREVPKCIAVRLGYQAEVTCRAQNVSHSQLSHIIFIICGWIITFRRSILILGRTITWRLVVVLIRRRRVVSRIREAASLISY